MKKSNKNANKKIENRAKQRAGEVSQSGLMHTNLVYTVVLWLVFGSISIGAMFIAVSNKSVVWADENTYQVYEGVKNLDTEKLLMEFVVGEGKAGALSIALPKYIEESSISIENNYSEQSLCIHMGRPEQILLEDFEILGDSEKIVSASYDTNGDMLSFEFRMDGIYEYTNTFKDNVLVINIKPMHDVYDYVVVVDAGNQVGDIAGKLKENLGNDRIKLIVCENDGTEGEAGRVVDIVESADADLYVGIVLGADEDASKYGIYGIYNDEYFIPGFGNAQVADAITRSVTIEASNRAIGLFAADENTVLKELKIPAACVSVGFVSNEAEKTLIEQEAYRDKLSNGVAKGILEIYNNLENSGEK